ncbi:MAG TPA: hypothetical protein EYN96_06735 [Candidatus Hydrogenedentes bacterium]|nr:hypothetical protein [Candidatus Hydrogenedentota bacterium]
MQPIDFIPSLYLLYILNNTLLMPVPLRYQLAPTLVFSAGMIALFVAYKEPTYIGESINAIIMVFSLSIIGFVASRAIGRYRRMNYIHLTGERGTREELENTLEHVKQVPGILPICAYCLKIRDEHGIWHKTETYIEEHSEAQFNHGACPECAELHHKDLV